jgi:hypothetical protein
VRQAVQDQELRDQALKQPYVLSQDSVSELNALKKLHQFLMTAQEGPVAEEDEESNLQLSFFINRKIEIMHRHFYLNRIAYYRNLLWSVLASENRSR